MLIVNPNTVTAWGVTMGKCKYEKHKYKNIFSLIVQIQIEMMLLRA